MDTGNIASHLPRMARLQPETPAVIVPHLQRQYSYAELERESDRLARGMQALGIGKGMRTVLMVTPGLDFFALVFALYKVGAVMVAVDPGIGLRNLGRCLAEAEPEAFIGIGKAHMARLLLGWARSTLRINILAGSGLWWGMADLNGLRQLGSRSTAALPEVVPGDQAAILFTSGSTGVPKGVIYSHANFNAQLDALRETFAIEPGEIDLATFPLFGLFAPALGMTAVIPKMDFTRPGSVNPGVIARLIDDYQITTMFGSPALLKRVGRWGVAEGRKFPSLRRVISAGAPVAAPILENFQKLLRPGVEIATPYGATESLPVSAIGSGVILAETAEATAQGRGICVGRPVAGIEVRVIGISDTPIERWSEGLCLTTGEIGEIVVRGPQVTAGYYNRPQATGLAKIPAADSGFYHRMGDLGYLDGEGRIWFCGRKSQRVTTEHGTLFTIPCEGVFNIHPAVSRSALVGVESGQRIRPVLCVELEEEYGRRDQQRIRTELLETGNRFAHTREIRDILFHPGFPVDIRHNAKIGRERLAQWARRRLS